MPIVLPRRYQNEARRQWIRLCFQVEALQRTRRAGQHRKKTLGAAKFFAEIVMPVVERSSSKFVFEDGELYAPNLALIEGDDTKLKDFLRAGKFEDRVFSDELYRVAEAWLHLEAPGFDLGFDTRRRMEEAGILLGAFLRDEHAAYDRYDLALSKQRLLGVYRYNSLDTHYAATGEMRLFALLSSGHSDYLQLLDAPETSLYHEDEKYNEASEVYFGFCVPGREFSPVLMKSHTDGFRQIGILYTPGQLVDMSGGVLDAMQYEIFTTQKRHLGSHSARGTSAGDRLFKKALDLHYGPKKRLQLDRLDAATAQALGEKFEVFLGDMLQWN